MKLIIGSRVRQKIVDECREKRVLILCTSSAFHRYKKDTNLIALFAKKNLLFEHDFDCNPSLSDIMQISKKYRDISIDLIIGIGGGSAMDVAKVASASIPACRVGLQVNDLINDSALFSQFKVIDCILVPTTAGTGSEVTPFATIWDYERKQKKSLTHPTMFAKKTFVDPDFLSQIPMEIAIATGLDALNQAFESIWNINANELTRSLSRQAAILALNSLPIIHETPNNSNLRRNLSLASLFAGLAISQTRTSICHSISYPLTLKYGILHGMACSFSMLEVFKYNSKFIKEDIEFLRLNLKQDPYVLLESIFIQYDINNYLLKLLPKKSSFFESVDDFITVGRFENNIRKCIRSDLIDIITNSYNSLIKL